jgi:hypothetical protein
VTYPSVEIARRIRQALRLLRKEKAAKRRREKRRGRLHGLGRNMKERPRPGEESRPWSRRAVARALHARITSCRKDCQSGVFCRVNAA